MTKPTTVDEYIHRFDGITRDRLIEIRKLARKLLPDAEEKISYQVPAYYKNGYIVYFAGYEKFVSLYPVHSISSDMQAELAPYLSGKATARFPHDKPLPEDIIKKIIKMLIEINAKRKSK